MKTAPTLHTGLAALDESNTSIEPNRSGERARSSAGERPLHTRKVVGSKPTAPTTHFTPYLANPAALQNVAQRFWRYVDKSGGAAACWPWTASQRASYGRFRLRSYVNVSAHRVADLLGHGEDPGALCVCHDCDNPPCCNPDHLFLGTTQDNTADMMAKGRHRTVGRGGETNPRAKLSAEHVEAIRAMIWRGDTNKAIAAQFGVTHSMISRIRRGRAWGEPPMQEKYASLRGRAA